MFLLLVLVHFFCCDRMSWQKEVRGEESLQLQVTVPTEVRKSKQELK